MTEEELVAIHPEGNRPEGRGNVSSEYRMHVEVYRRREDAKGVVHGHPPTAFTVAGISLTDPVLPEIVVTLGGNFHGPP